MFENLILAVAFLGVAIAGITYVYFDSVIRRHCPGAAPFSGLSIANVAGLCVALGH